LNNPAEFPRRNLPKTFVFFEEEQRKHEENNKRNYVMKRENAILVFMARALSTKADLVNRKFQRKNAQFPRIF
jgi:hypothetical protein